jgi:hypothetical protein
MIIEATDIIIGVLFISGILITILSTEGVEGIFINLFGLVLVTLSFISMCNYGYFGYRFINTKGYLIRETSYGYLIENGSKFIKIEDHQSVVFIKNHPKNFRIYTNKELFGEDDYIATF